MRAAATILSTIILAAILRIPAGAQSSAVPPTAGETADHSAANGPRGGQTAEAIQADALYKAQNFVAALPLYEDLHNRHPRENMWRERLAMCVIAAPANEAELAANLQRARQLLLDAKASGDNSNLLQEMLEKLSTPPPASLMSASPAMPAFNQAEKAFSSGQLAEALKLYQEAAAADPKFYDAPLYAGDTEYKRGNYAEADKWYAQAAAIDPNREAAYRYWGDCLMKQGQPAEAEGRFIEAVLAEPYLKSPRLGLKQWADATHAKLVAPPVSLPPWQEVGPTGGTVHIDANAAKGPMGLALTTYVLGSTSFRFGGFAKAYPNEKTYRHSLAEEATSIRMALSALKKQNLPADQINETWTMLGKLDTDGMLECWILLDHADQGIAQDYAAYRAGHRDLLHAYMAKYDVRPN
jgi:tetratricopeptide (TPR) repeat protein